VVSAKQRDLIRITLIERPVKGAQNHSKVYAPCLESKKKRYSLKTIMSPVHKVPLMRRNKS
jgi:hypothetical protein